MVFQDQLPAKGRGERHVAHQREIFRPNRAAIGHGIEHEQHVPSGFREDACREKPAPVATNIVDVAGNRPIEIQVGWSGIIIVRWAGLKNGGIGARLTGGRKALRQAVKIFAGPAALGLVFRPRSSPHLSPNDRKQ